MASDKTNKELPGVVEKQEYASRVSSPTSSTAPGGKQLHNHNVNPYAMLKNPLTGLSKEDVLTDVEAFAREKNLEHSLDDLRRGALVARDPKAFETIDELSEDDKVYLRREKSHRWHQPWLMYFMTTLCAGSAIVQGMDQSSVNGAQVFYFEEFGLQQRPDEPVNYVWLRGLINGAPYLCSALIGCWTTKPLNYYFGRRGCIFISCFISFVTGIWMAVADSWPNLLVARFALGLAVGAKSSTTPVYAAECAPTMIRGALTMMWQMWTAFGIMLGLIVSVAFQNVTTESIPGLNWRLMLGSTGIPPLIVMGMVYFCPESPRWYMTKNKYDKAYDALQRFRPSKLQASRDLYYIHKSLVIEMKQKEGKNLWHEFFLVPRNRRAAQSSFFVMFMQQWCGVNVVAYYSSQIFLDSGFSRSIALTMSLGTGIVNWLFAIPAVYTIGEHFLNRNPDTFGRRNLLLTTFPLMGLCLLFTAFSFLISSETARTACVATGIYLFMAVYSPGEGPVPFTYSAEAFPLYVREYGMAFATAVTWGFNFILAFTWPALQSSFGNTGAFGWYAAWNFVGLGWCYFFLPETAKLSLEELDMVFSTRTRDHARYYLDMLPWYWNRYILRGDVEPRKRLYESDD